MLLDVFTPPVDWVPADLPDVDPEAVAVDVVEPLGAGELVAVVAVELDGVAFEEAGFGVVPEEEHPAIVSSAMASADTADFERMMYFPVLSKVNRRVTLPREHARDHVRLAGHRVRTRGEVAVVAARYRLARVGNRRVDPPATGAVPGATVGDLGR